MGLGLGLGLGLGFHFCTEMCLSLWLDMEIAHGAGVIG